MYVKTEQLFASDERANKQLIKMQLLSRSYFLTDLQTGMTSLKAPTKHISYYFLLINFSLHLRMHFDHKKNIFIDHLK